MQNNQKDKIKILFLINSLNAGGAERVLIDIVTNLDKSIFEPIVLCLHKKGVYFDLLNDYCESICLNLPNRIRLRGFVRLFQEITKHKPKIVHTFLNNPNRWGVLAAKFASVPIVVTSLQNCYYHENLHHKLFDLFCFKFVTRSVACSEAVRTFHIKNKWYPSGKIQVIYNSTDVSKFNISTDKKVIRRTLGLPEKSFIIGTVASLTEQKGHKYLIEAAKKVVSASEDVLFIIVGDGNLRKNLEEMVHSMNLDASIMFLGVRKDIPKIMSSLDIFALPSLWEGFGIVIAEAMACGLPVIASNVDGIPEIIVNGETGILVPPKDTQALAMAIIDLIHYPEKRNKMGVAGRKRVENHFSVKNMVSKYEKLYTV